jgi:hypothetical protein
MKEITDHIILDKTTLVFILSGYVSEQQSYIVFSTGPYILRGAECCADSETAT